MDHLARHGAPAGYLELGRFLPTVGERAQALYISPRLVRVLDNNESHSRAALSQPRVNLLLQTLQQLERKLGSPTAANIYLLANGHLRQMRSNGGQQRDQLVADA